MERVYLNQVRKRYRISPIHNIKHFISSSLYIEQEGDRIYLKGKHFKKNFTKIAVLYPLNQKKSRFPAILEPDFIR